MTGTKQDVIIVGAGIVGLATAYELAGQGASVTIVEGHEPGWAASRVNAGMIHATAVEPMVNPDYARKSFRWMLTRGGESPLHFSPLKVPGLLGWGLKALAACNQPAYERGKRALEEFGRCILPKFVEYRANGIDYEEHPGGYLETWVEAKAFRHDTAHYVDDPAVEVMSGDAAREREPLLSRNVVGAAQMPSDGFTSLYPPDLCRKFAARLGEMGVGIRTSVEVTGARRDGGKVTALHTAAGDDLRADHFVVTAGGWSGKVAALLGSRAAVTGGKGYSFTMDAPATSPSQTVYLAEYKAVVVPFDGRLRVTGFLDFRGIDMKVLGRRIRALRRIAGRYLREVPQGRLEVQETGMRACSPDGLPLIGRLPGLDNAWIGSGHWHFGLTLAPPTAVMLADLITTGSSDMDTAPFDPGRV